VIKIAKNNYNIDSGMFLRFLLVIAIEMVIASFKNKVFADCSYETINVPFLYFL
jgi:hypothetical protein